MTTVKLSALTCTQYTKKDGSMGFKSLFLSSDGDAFPVYTKNEILIGCEYEFKVVVYDNKPTLRILA